MTNLAVMAFSSLTCFSSVSLNQCKLDQQKNHLHVGNEVQAAVCSDHCLSSQDWSYHFVRSAYYAQSVLYNAFFLVDYSTGHKVVIKKK